MKMTFIIAVSVALIGSSAVSHAAGPNNGSHGASGFAPGIQMQTTTPSPQDRGATQGASQLTPAGQMKDTTPPALNGASTFSPGPKKRRWWRPCDFSNRHWKTPKLRSADTRL